MRPPQLPGQACRTRFPSRRNAAGLTTRVVLLGAILNFWGIHLSGVTRNRFSAKVQEPKGMGRGRSVRRTSSRSLGETPLSVQWVWPGPLTYPECHETMKTFCCMLARAWTELDVTGDPIEIGHEFIDTPLLELMAGATPNGNVAPQPILHLAALVCCSAFDIAVHDAYGRLLGQDDSHPYCRATPADDPRLQSVAVTGETWAPSGRRCRAC